MEQAGLRVGFSGGDGSGTHRRVDVRLEAALVHKSAVGGASIPEEGLAGVAELQHGVEARARGVLEDGVAARVPPKGEVRLR